MHNHVIFKYSVCIYTNKRFFCVSVKRRVDKRLFISSNHKVTKKTQFIVKVKPINAQQKNILIQKIKTMGKSSAERGREYRQRQDKDKLRQEAAERMRIKR